MAEEFEPTLGAMHAKLNSVQASEYARSRNALDGAVTKLSPYITHGMLSLPEVVHSVLQRQPLPVRHKLVFELGWREYFSHVWQKRGEEIFQSLHPGLLPDSAYAAELPSDITQARTGIATIDQAVRSLYATGYLHNHARMWLASYMVHLRKVHWRVGADWMYAHLLDGDLASNHLSWQWVAATSSRKPYLFNADNVARYAPPSWHASGSVLDTSYEALEEIARSRTPVVGGSSEIQATAEPVVVTHFAAAPHVQNHTPDLSGRDVWLVHPWALGEPPPCVPSQALRLGITLTDFHTRWPWSLARWQFVTQRMAEVCDMCWHVDAAHLHQALRTARSVHTAGNAHIDAYLPAHCTHAPSTALFYPVEPTCDSFFQWFKHAVGPAQHCTDLPGLRRLHSPPTPTPR
jgi:deoxyribodipyrimidine photo-lyase